LVKFAASFGHAKAKKAFSFTGICPPPLTFTLAVEVMGPARMLSPGRAVAVDGPVD